VHLGVTRFLSDHAGRFVDTGAGATFPCFLHPFCLEEGSLPLRLLLPKPMTCSRQCVYIVGLQNDGRCKLFFIFR
jgi:hypothetical protein